MQKKAKLRYNEYYDMQECFDSLYTQSKNGNNFYKLLEIIGSEANICLAYRNLKQNEGSKTAGPDGKTIGDISRLPEYEVVRTIQEMLADYQPNPVRRVFIPKPGSDKKRPLGIPCIWDRLFQQCILQVLEPICEPKFHNHSYGFRPNRDAKHAMSRVVSMINLNGHFYCVDIDIKGFFDNVRHGKLLKQIWTLGIRDKRLISIISKILKSEIVGEGIPDKGTPQGGIISPLLSLIVLNELDWWVSNQWETFVPNHARKTGAWYSYARKYTHLKDGFIVRYADDFKIMCKTYEEAKRWYYATVDFLDKRLGLEISPEKSKVVNMKKNSSNYLGFKIKVVPKGKTKCGFVAKTDMSKKAIDKAINRLKGRIQDIKKNATVLSIMHHNQAVKGIQNYYNIATNVARNMSYVNYILLPAYRIHLRQISKIIPFRDTDETFKKLTVGLHEDRKIVTIGEHPLLPPSCVRHVHPMNFSQDICNYTVKGRSKIHNKLTIVGQEELKVLQIIKDRCENIEFNDNRISAFIVQRGKCYITGLDLNLSDMRCLRKKPLEAGGSNSYRNIAFVNNDVYKAIMEYETNQARSICKYHKLPHEQRYRLNYVRRNYGNKAFL